MATLVDGLMGYMAMLGSPITHPNSGAAQSHTNMEIIISNSVQ